MKKINKKKKNKKIQSLCKIKQRLIGEKVKNY